MANSDMKAHIARVAIVNGCLAQFRQAIDTMEPMPQVGHPTREDARLNLSFAVQEMNGNPGLWRDICERNKVNSEQER